MTIKSVNSLWTKTLWCEHKKKKKVLSKKREQKTFTVTLGKEMLIPLTRKQPDIIPGCSWSSPGSQESISVHCLTLFKLSFRQNKLLWLEDKLQVEIRGTHALILALLLHHFTGFSSHLCAFSKIQTLSTFEICWLKGFFKKTKELFN